MSRAFRGTPRREARPSRRAHPCVFFARQFEWAIDFATGGEQGRTGYVQEYDIPNVHLFSADDECHVAMLAGVLARPLDRAALRELFHYPTPKVVEWAKKFGFGGLAIGEYVCLFNTRGVRLLRRWKLIWNDRLLKYEVVPDVG